MSAMHLVIWIVRNYDPVCHKGVMLDLGALQGLRIDCAAELLREAGVTRRILHGGTSTASLLGIRPRQSSWKVALESFSCVRVPEPIAIPPISTQG